MSYLWYGGVMRWHTFTELAGFAGLVVQACCAARGTQLHSARELPPAANPWPPTQASEGKMATTNPHPPPAHSTHPTQEEGGKAGGPLPRVVSPTSPVPRAPDTSHPCLKLLGSAAVSRQPEHKAGLVLFLARPRWRLREFYPVPPWRLALFLARPATPAVSARGRRISCLSLGISCLSLAYLSETAGDLLLHVPECRLPPA